MTQAHPLRVLYIDDDRALCRLVVRDLARHGYNVTAAHTGAEGETTAASASFDAICLDQQMPDQDGMTTLAHLRARPDCPPVVFVTGSDEGRVAVAALHAGAADYVIKEASPDFLGLLRAALDSAIEREMLRRQNEQAVAELRQARDRAEELARQREVLLREVNHRVANSLQLIAALTSLQETQVADPAARGALAEVRNRVFAVAQVHRRLYTSGDPRQVQLHDYLAGLVREIGRAADSTAAAFEFHLDLAPLGVPTDTAVSVGIVTAELVTNAIKYAYPRGTGGPIHISLRPEDDAAVLVVADDGIGMPAQPEDGVGQRIVRAVASGMGGQVTAEPAARGTRFRLAFPLGVPSARPPSAAPSTAL